MTTPSPDPQPAVARPPTAAGWAHTVVQTVAAVALFWALWRLLGLDLAVLIASAVTFTGSITMETMSRRGPRPVLPPTPGGDR